MNLRKLVKPHIRSLHAYQAENTPCKVKLDANESPYGFRVFTSVLTNRYPDPEAKTLRKLVAGKFRVKPENILHGNGSDELIYYLVTVFGGPVLYPVPTFSMYGIIAQALGEPRVSVPLNEEFDLEVTRILKEIRKRKPKLIFLSSPNNPTGNSFSAEKIMDIVKQTQGLVIVDEAYHQFSKRRSFLPLVRQHTNVAVLRTFSKIGLAGLRVGFLVADAEVIQEVNKVRLPFNLNSLSQHVAVRMLKDRKRIRSFVRAVNSERKRLFHALSQCDGVKPYPSDANFILFKVKHADRIYRELLSRGVLVRNMKGIVEGCLRVTVGTPVENGIFLKALKQLL